jgi:hypothetical protein
MSQDNPKIHAALAIACLALALSVYAAVRGSSAAKSGGTCVDPEARDQTAKLRQALAERDAMVARLVRATAAPGARSMAGAPLPPSPSAAPPESGPRRYAHFEIPNPAVSVTQKDEGTYDIRTTDPTLAGSVIQITAITSSGEEHKMLIRIPR